VALVDFHDVMELILDAANTQQVQQDQNTGTDCQQGAAQEIQGWSKGLCPNCGETEAEVDPEGILWCPACGYSKKGCYT
jgi:predicted RNA-binding Zn-ribbon protein involved in translation (DUF1610 family)